MIVGVDHVALTCADLDGAVADLRAWGFETRFIEEDIPNPPSKRPFLGSYRDTHSIAYCGVEAGVAVELVNHGTASGWRGPYEVMVAGRPPPSSTASDREKDWDAVWESALGIGGVTCVTLPTTRAPLWCSDESSTQAGVRAVGLSVSDVNRSASFWSDGAGFRPSAEGEAGGRKWARLTLQAPVPSWSLDVVLVEDGGGWHSVPLDALGFSCLALLSTGIERDLARLASCGGRESSEVFDLRVGGKKLRLLLLRGPDGEPVELVEARRR